MDDAVLPIPPTARIAGAPMFLPHQFVDPAPEPAGNAAAFAYSSDRLVRHLFDVGLQLHTLQAIFDQPHATGREIKAASDAVGIVLGDLDMLIHDAGLTMLALSIDSIGAVRSGQGSGPSDYNL